MRDLILIAATAAMLLFGYFAASGADNFADKFICHDTPHPNTISSDTAGSSLRIGLSNPICTEGITDIIEKYSSEYPDISVCLLSGDDKELIDALSAHKLDVIFLPEDTKNLCRDYDSIPLMLKCTPVVVNRSGLCIEPIKNGVIQNAVWSKADMSCAAVFFLDFLRKKKLECKV